MLDTSLVGELYQTLLSPMGLSNKQIIDCFLVFVHVVSICLIKGGEIK